jgi:hypothetical protein
MAKRYKDTKVQRYKVTKIQKQSFKAGIVGTFPALNQRTSEGFEGWLIEIQTRLTH